MVKRGALADRSTATGKQHTARRRDYGAALSPTPAHAVAPGDAAVLAALRAWLREAPAGAPPLASLAALAAALAANLGVRHVCLVLPATVADSLGLTAAGELIGHLPEGALHELAQAANSGPLPLAALLGAGRARGRAWPPHLGGLPPAKPHLEALAAQLPLSEGLPDHVILQPVPLEAEQAAGLLCILPAGGGEPALLSALLTWRATIAQVLAERLLEHSLGQRLHEVQGALDRRLFHLLTLLDFSSEFLRHAQHEHTLTNVLFTAMGHLGAHAGCLFLATEAHTALECQRWRGLPDDAMAGLRVPMQDALVRAAAAQGTPLHRQDLAQAWRASAFREVPPLTNLELCGPLMLGDRLLGLFLFGPKLSGHPYGDDDREFLTILSNHAAMAVENARLVSDLESARRTLLTENRSLRRALSADSPVRNIVGKSDSMQRVLDIVQRVCDLPVNVLITGESGTGKELVARAIHYSGNRANRPFVSLNCASLPESLLESELFGIESGVATGVTKKIGKIEQANGGTLFLDEVADTSLAMQAKVLRVLQEREVQRVGGRSTISVDVRLVAATNKDLQAAIQERTFREDLYYRLNVVALRLPPLRERRDDIPLLTRHLLEKAMARLGQSGVTLAPETLQALVAYPWPGNVRELENEVERLVALVEPGTRIEPAWLSEKIRLAPPLPSTLERGAAPRSLKEQVGLYEAEILGRVLAEHHGNRAGAARRLGISGEGLRKKLLRYGLA
ncbi:MAG: sigma 54-interacting transcriptional regulator [Candidatus Tectomicrobia bacterium]|nr:sigma 54-interacting transcriptional regulator [Candidatus Tectomicrobia bacterium]